MWVKEGLSAVLRLMRCFLNELLWFCELTGIYNLLCVVSQTLKPSPQTCSPSPAHVWNWEWPSSHHYTAQTLVQSPSLSPSALFTSSHPASETQDKPQTFSALSFCLSHLAQFHFCSGHLNHVITSSFLSLSLTSRARAVIVWDSECGDPLCLRPAATSLYVYMFIFLLQ